MSSAIIEVVIGMVLAYSLLSILVAQINNILIDLINYRSHFLRDGIARFIKDKYVLDELLRHPFISIVTDEKEKPSRLWQIWLSIWHTLTNLVVRHKQYDTSLDGNLTGKTNVDQQVFTTVLISLVDYGQPLLEQIYKQFMRLFDEWLPDSDSAEVNKLKKDLAEALDKVLLHLQQSDSDPLQELREGITYMLPRRGDPSEKDVPGSLPQKIHKPITDFRGLILNELLPKLNDKNLDRYMALRERPLKFLAGIEKVQQKMRRLKEQVQQDFIDVRKSVQRWVDNEMELMSQLYRKKMQFLSLIIGFLLALLLNIDSIYIARTLWNDPVMRDAVNDAAQKFAESNLKDETAGTGDVETDVRKARESLNTLEQSRLPVGWVYVTYDSVEDTEPSPDSTLSDMSETPTSDSTLSDMSETPTSDSTLSETDEAATSVISLIDPRTDSRNFRNLLPGDRDMDVWLKFIVMKLIGLLLTGMAISLGSDFWFNILRNLTSRSGGSGGSSNSNNSSSDSDKD